MDSIEKFEESMKVLDILSIFINAEDENYIRCEEIRLPLEEAFRRIYGVYQKYGDNNIEEEMRKKWIENRDDFE